MSTEITNKIFTLPNLISCIRLLLVPIFAILLVVYQNNIAAFVLFLIAATTDFVDGAVARTTGQVSRLGQQLDPLVDRILILTAVILIYILGRVPFWVLLLLVARDLSLLVLLAQLRSTGQPRFKVALVGKAATACNMVGFCLLILSWPEVGGLGIVESAALPGWGSTPALLGIWFIYIGVALAWIAALYYMARAYFISGNSKSGSAGQGGGKGFSAKGGASSRYQKNAQDFHGEAVHPANRRGAKERDAGGSRNTQRAARKASTVQHSFTRQRSQRESKHQGRRGLLSTPRRMVVAAVMGVFLLFALGFYLFDGISNFGVIHAGVKVGSVEVGALEEAEAASLLETELSRVAYSAPVVFYTDEEARAAGDTSATQQLGNGVEVYDQTEVQGDATSWSVTLSTLDAKLNAEELAQEAFGVGRNGDFLLGRLAAATLGVTVNPQVEFSTERLHSLENMLTQSIGTPMQNASISFDGEQFVASDGIDGFVVDEERFVALLQQAFFSEEREFIVPMIERKMQVTLEDAEKVAEEMQLAVSEPVTVSYEDDSWTLSSIQLSQVLTTSFEQDEGGKWSVVPAVDATLLETVLPGITGQLEDQITPLNAEFVVVEGQLQIIPSQNGTGVDYQQLAADLNAVLFGAESNEEDTSGEEMQGEGDTQNAESTENSESGLNGAQQERTVFMRIGVLEPEIKTSEAEAFDFSQKISEFTIEYPWVGEGTVTNIHVASDLINSSIIAPQGIWSFNETAGECTADKGFVEAKVILNDEYADEIGGGVCNVASTVFNAAYEAGYPIVERVNHSLRLSRYPVGRDAAIAYPYADLKFLNDTENYVLLTMSYTDTSVTCTLWGKPPGYRIESVEGELVEGEAFQTKEVVNEALAAGQKYIEQAGKKASKVQVTRTVYYADGRLKETNTFYSSYNPTTEIVQVGPDKQ